MQVSFRTVVVVAAGVILFDYLFSGKAAVNLLGANDLSANQADSCHCGGACHKCSVNVTDRAQVIDVTPLRENAPYS